MIKQTRGAIKFLLAEYRAVLKNAMLAMAVAAMTMVSSETAGAEPYSFIDEEDVVLVTSPITDATSFDINNATVINQSSITITNDIPNGILNGSMDIGKEESATFINNPGGVLRLLGSSTATVYDGSSLVNNGSLYIYDGSKFVNEGEVKNCGNFHILDASTITNNGTITGITNSDDSVSFGNLYIYSGTLESSADKKNSSAEFETTSNYGQFTNKASLKTNRLVLRSDSSTIIDEYGSLLFNSFYNFSYSGSLYVNSGTFGFNKNITKDLNLTQFGTVSLGKNDSTDTATLQASSITLGNFNAYGNVKFDTGKTGKVTLTKDATISDTTSITATGSIAVGSEGSDVSLAIEQGASVVSEGDTELYGKLKVSGSSSGEQKTYSSFKSNGTLTAQSGSLIRINKDTNVTTQTLNADQNSQIKVYGGTLEVTGKQGLDLSNLNTSYEDGIYNLLLAGYSDAIIPTVSTLRATDITLGNFNSYGNVLLDTVTASLTKSQTIEADSFTVTGKLAIAGKNISDSSPEIYLGTDTSVTAESIAVGSDTTTAGSLIASQGASIVSNGDLEISSGSTLALKNPEDYGSSLIVKGKTKITGNKTTEELGQLNVSGSYSKYSTASLLGLVDVDGGRLYPDSTGIVRIGGNAINSSTEDLTELPSLSVEKGGQLTVHNGGRVEYVNNARISGNVNIGVQDGDDASNSGESSLYTFGSNLNIDGGNVKLSSKGHLANAYGSYNVNNPAYSVEVGKDTELKLTNGGSLETVGDVSVDGTLNVGASEDSDTKKSSFNSEGTLTAGSGAIVRVDKGSTLIAKNLSADSNSKINIKSGILETKDDLNLTHLSTSWYDEYACWQNGLILGGDNATESTPATLKAPNITLGYFTAENNVLLDTGNQGKVTFLCPSNIKDTNISINGDLKVGNDENSAYLTFDSGASLNVSSNANIYKGTLIFGDGSSSAVSGNAIVNQGSINIVNNGSFSIGGELTQSSLSGPVLNVASNNELSIYPKGSVYLTGYSIIDGAVVPSDINGIANIAGTLTLGKSNEDSDTKDLSSFELTKGTLAVNGGKVALNKNSQLFVGADSLNNELYRKDDTGTGDKTGRYSYIESIGLGIGQGSFVNISNGGKIETVRDSLIYGDLNIGTDDSGNSSFNTDASFKIDHSGKVSVNNNSTLIAKAGIVISDSLDATESQNSLTISNKGEVTTSGIVFSGTQASFDDAKTKAKIIVDGGTLNITGEGTGANNGSDMVAVIATTAETTSASDDSSSVTGEEGTSGVTTTYTHAGASGEGLIALKNAAKVVISHKNAINYGDTEIGYKYSYADTDNNTVKLSGLNAIFNADANTRVSITDLPAVDTKAEFDELKSKLLGTSSGTLCVKIKEFEQQSDVLDYQYWADLETIEKNKQSITLEDKRVINIDEVVTGTNNWANATLALGEDVLNINTYTDTSGTQKSSLTLHKAADDGLFVAKLDADGNRSAGSVNLNDSNSLTLEGAGSLASVSGGTGSSLITAGSAEVKADSVNVGKLIVDEGASLTVAGDVKLTASSSDSVSDTSNDNASTIYGQLTVKGGNLETEDLILDDGELIIEPVEHNYVTVNGWMQVTNSAVKSENSGLTLNAKKDVSVNNSSFSVKDVFTVNNERAFDVAGSTVKAGKATIEGTTTLSDGTELKVTNLLTSNGKLSLDKSTVSANSVELNGETSLSESSTLTATDTLTVAQTLKLDNSKAEVKTAILNGETDLTDNSTLEIADSLTANGVLTLSNSIGKANQVTLNGITSLQDNSKLIVADVLKLGNTLKVDPSYVFAGNGIEFTSPGAVLAVLKDSVVVNGSGTSETTGTGANLYLNKNIDLSNGGKIYLNGNQTNSEFNEASVIAQVTLGENSKLIVNQSAIDSAEADNKAVVQLANDGTIAVSDGASVDVNLDKAKAQTVKLFNKAVDADGKTKLNTSGVGLNLNNVLFTATVDTDAGNTVIDVKVKDDTSSVLDGLDSDVKDTIISQAKGDGFDTTQDNGLGYVSKALQGTSADAVRAIGSLTNYAFASYAPQVALLADDAGFTAVSQRAGFNTQSASTLGAVNGDTASVWVTPLYRKQSSDSFDIGGLEYGAKTNLYGLALGADFALPLNLRAGVSLHVGNGKAKSEGNFNYTQNEFDFFGGELYGFYQGDNLSVLADVGYTHVSNDVEQGSLKSDFDSKVFSAGIKAKYVFNTGLFDIAPHAGVRYSHAKVDGFKVKSDNGTLLNADNMSGNIVKVPVGVTISNTFKDGDWSVKPLADISVITAFGDKDWTSTSHITGMTANNGRVSVDADVVDTVSVAGTLGIEAQMGNRLSVGAGYTFTKSENIREHALTTSFRYAF